MVSVKNRTNLLLLVFLVITFTSFATFSILGQKTSGYKPGVSLEYDRAVNQAQSLFSQKQKLGVDFSNGPCLSNDLLPGWVADIVHNPRQKIDDLPINQCQAYLEGRAKHFVELDLDGNVVRVQ